MPSHRRKPVSSAFFWIQADAGMTLLNLYNIFRVNFLLRAPHRAL